MEEETVNRRRSTRSRSKPPMEISEIRSNEPANSRVSTRFQSIQEMVIQEQTQSTEVTVTSVSVEQTFVQTDEAIELQNRLNQNQEVTKSIASKTAENEEAKRARRSVRAKQSSVVNGSSTVKKMKKSVGKSSEVASETPVTSRSVASTSGKRYSTYTRTTDESLARKLYKAVISGEKDVTESVFWRFYRPVGEWWNYYPKTDNTYSPLSSCRYELAPGMMAMPNLSRRSIQGTHRASFNSWFSNADSDSEEYESGQQIRRQQTTFTQKVTTTTKRIFISTVTTIMTIFTLIYGYTIGTVVGGITRGTADQGAEVSNTPLLLRPVQWIVDMVRYFTLIEVTFWAWLGKGQRRNILLWLLLFLLFAVPTYILYKGGYEFTVINTLISEIKNSYAIPFATKIRDNFYSITAPLINYVSPYFSQVGENFNNITVPFLGGIRTKLNI